MSLMQAGDRPPRGAGGGERKLSDLYLSYYKPDDFHSRARMAPIIKEEKKNR